MLYLLPNLLSSEKDTLSLLPACLPEIFLKLDGMIGESQTEILRYLKHFPTKKPYNHIPFTLLNEHTKKDELDFILEPLTKGETWGLISDAGLPAIADPGAELVALARRKKIPIKAISGPSSLFLSLMLSGLPSQQFGFHGYPPRDKEELAKWFQKLQRKSIDDKSTEVFIEAPYRNQTTYEILLQSLKPLTRLSISQDLTGPKEWTKTLPVKQWKDGHPKPFIDKSPAIFIINA